jgi:hypothetical protein
MSSIGKVTVYYRVTEIKCLDQDVEIVEETPEGVTVWHTYRKTGRRKEFIPRDKLQGIIYEDVRADPKPVEKPEEKPAVADVDTDDIGILSESEDFDDSGDEFDDDDEFE